MLAAKRNRFLVFFRRTRALWLALVMFTVGAQSVWAQYGVPIPGMSPYYPRTNRTNNNNPNSNQNSPTPFQGTATITGIGSSGLEVIDANGKNWRLAPEKNCVIEVTGTADPSFLKPDMLVRFSAQFDKKGNATAPVNELEIVSPQAALNSIKQEVAGKKDVSDNINGALIGHIKGIKNNQLTVQTTNGTYTAALSPNPSIKVNVSDFHWAVVGDKVDASGYYSPQGLAVAKEMRITLSNPLGEGGKKKPATKAAGTSTTTTK
jgi:hypothetical protein